MAQAPDRAGVDVRLGALVDEINLRLVTQDFSLDLTVECVGRASAPMKRICADIRAHLDRLDVDQLQPEDPEASWGWTDGDWCLRLTANPLAAERRNDGGRIVRTHGLSVRILEDVDPCARY